jgi:hypothetical protein
MSEEEGGYRVEIRLDEAPDCPVAEMTVDGDVESYAVSRSSRFDAEVEAPVVTEEMLFDGDPEDADVDAEIEHVFSYDDKEVYRFEREADLGCACEIAEADGVPIVESRARDGGLDLTFHSPDVETIRAVIGDLEDHYDRVDVRRMLRSREESEVEDLVFVDRSGLTDRQREVLETAHRMGYFDHPKGANGQEVAAALDIAPTTFSEHLSRAQDKILAAVLD